MTASPELSSVQAEPLERPDLVSLDDPAARDASLVGSKGASLAMLRANGLAVPDGFVITTAARVPSRTDGLASAGVSAADDLGSRILAAAAALGPGPLAVRSSAVAEDLADASFAGQYETVLGVEDDAQILAAVDRVRASASDPRVARYRAARTSLTAASPVAVVVQRLVPADVAGVAFTADPVTGDRGSVVVSAVRGLGERLVSGAASPDEWVVRDGVASARRTVEGSLDAPLAMTVADIARRVEAFAGAPQDIEWAAAGGQVFLLQSRPMTALPEPVSWDPPRPGVWIRNFRLGEWLGDPVTSLFESWALTVIEDVLDRNLAATIRMRPRRPGHVLVNGWYFYGGFNIMPTSRSGLLGMFAKHVLPNLLMRPRRASMAFPPLAHIGIELWTREWREQVQPRYRATVSRATAEVETARAERLVALVDELAAAAGEYFTYIAAVAGFATKAELPLARFYRQHLAARLDGSHLDLLAGLGDEPPRAMPHAMLGLDWIQPARGEAVVGAGADLAARHTQARERRTVAEARVRAALADDAKQLRRFDRLLAQAQRFGRFREEQAAEFTLPWPVMRRAVVRLGEEIARGGHLETAEQVFFLTRDELSAALRGGARSYAELATERRAAWEHQRPLAPPLILGELPPMLARFLHDFEDAFRGPAAATEGGIVGVPASPGRATGTVRIIRSPSEFDRIMAGDVLVSPVTTPAWTPLFGAIVAVVTDTGGLGSHSSIVAREYGIPAVVGTGDATRRLQDGEIVEVNGSLGTVVRVPAG